MHNYHNVCMWCHYGCSSRIILVWVSKFCLRSLKAEMSLKLSIDWHMSDEQFSYDHVCLTSYVNQPTVPYLMTQTAIFVLLVTEFCMLCHNLKNSIAAHVQFTCRHLYMQWTATDLFPTEGWSVRCKHVAFCSPCLGKFLKCVSNDESVEEMLKCSRVPKKLTIFRQISIMVNLTITSIFSLL